MRNDAGPGSPARSRCGSWTLRRCARRAKPGLRSQVAQRSCPLTSAVSQARATPRSRAKSVGGSQIPSCRSRAAIAARPVRRSSGDRATLRPRRRARPLQPIEAAPTPSGRYMAPETAPEALRSAARPLRELECVPHPERMPPSRARAQIASRAALTITPSGCPRAAGAAVGSVRASLAPAATGAAPSVGRRRGGLERGTGCQPGQSIARRFAPF